MPESWLEVYTRKNYIQVDPFVSALVSGLPEIMIDCGTLPTSDPAYELNHDLKLHGYGSLIGTAYGTCKMPPIHLPNTDVIPTRYRR